jgi:hypothetical protein
MEQLRQQCQIQHLMEISQVINPPDEEVVDAPDEVDDMLLALHCFNEQQQESDPEEPEEQLPIITPKQMLQHLEGLKLGEIQSDDCNAESLRWLERYTKIVRERHLKGLKQAGIMNYFTTGGARDQIDPQLL